MKFRKELDFKTMDKLCEINSDFEKFIGQTKTILTAPEEYLKGIRKEFAKNYSTIIISFSISLSKLFQFVEPILELQLLQIGRKLFNSKVPPLNSDII